MLNSPVWRGSPQYAFGLGLVAGGVLSALVLVSVGSLLRLLAPAWFWVGLVGVWFLLIALRELGAVSFRLPQNARLVPATVFRHGRFWGPFEFGLEMGTGVRTYVTSGLPYVLVPVIALFAGLPSALAAGIGFGLGRTLMTVANLRFSDDGSWDHAFASRQRLISGLLLAGFAVALLAVLAAGDGVG